MINDTVVSEGIKFKSGRMTRGQNNAVICRGQKIQLPAGPHNRLYLLAAAVNGDTTGEFKVDDHAFTLGVQDRAATSGNGTTVFSRAWWRKIFRILCGDQQPGPH